MFSTNKQRLSRAMSGYFDAIREELPGIPDDDFFAPLEQTGIDSVDRVCIRVILEKRAGEMPDATWNRFKTIGDAVAYCLQVEKDRGLAPVKAHKVVLRRGCEIGMPQMAKGCLSENWLFKELGDVHWALLCKGLHTRSGELKDEGGDRLYATFVRIQVVHPPLAAFGENERLLLEGSVKRFGSGTYISRITGRCGNKGVGATLMTSFTARAEQDNERLFKSTPSAGENTVPEHLSPPAFLSDYRLARKDLLESFEVDGTRFRVSNESVCETEYDLNPYYEINGVGLLYFASYPVISDVCEARYFNQMVPDTRRWENRWDVVARDVFYFANCNAKDTIIYKLNSYDYLDDGRLVLGSSLYRKSDGRLMARVYTVKTRV